jgi:integrase
LYLFLHQLWRRYARTGGGRKPTSSRLARHGGDTGLVFTTHLGGPLEPRNVNRSWYAIRSRAGLTNFRLHDLRHSCASFMLAAGASPRTVMKTLGHSQIGLTMNTYAHVLPEVERAAIDAAARAIFER